MRIQTICLSWFRGAAKLVALESENKSMVVYGQNGTGKSSFVDAVEYAINKGKLGHLSHEYSGRNQEKGIPNTQTPNDCTTEFSIKFEDGANLTVKIKPNGVYSREDTSRVEVEKWGYHRIVLRQSDIMNFIYQAKGMRYSTLLPLFGLQELEFVADNLKQISRTIKEQSKIEENKNKFSEKITFRNQFYESDTDEDMEGKIIELHKKYCPISKAIQALDRCEELETIFTRHIAESSSDQRHYLALRIIAEIDLDTAIKAIQNANAKLAGSIDPLIIEKLALLQTAEAFSLKLEDDKEKIKCPACGQLTPSSEFKAHIKAEKEQLQEIICFFNERKATINSFVEKLESIKTTLGKPEISVWYKDLKQGSLKAHIEWIEQSNVDNFRQALDIDNLITIQQNYQPLITKAIEAVQDTLPDTKILSEENSLVQAAKAGFEAKELAEKISQVEALIKFVNSLEKGIRAEIRLRCDAIIKDISNDIETMWKILHPTQAIKNVSLYLPESDKAIDIALTFHGKDQESPRLTLSEGFRHSLGLCIFLAMAKREENDCPLFLDDIVGSVDHDHRGMIAQLLESEFTERQIIIFTHERDWYAELRKQLDGRRWVFKTLLPYETPDVGIRFSKSITNFDDARAHLKNHRPDSAGNDARKIMDTELPLIAEELEIKLPYRCGIKNDTRTYSDFLNQLIADGKKSFTKKVSGDDVQYQDAVTSLTDADRLLSSWGNKSSHRFDVTAPEATVLIDSCEVALKVFDCISCSRSVWFNRNGKWFQCECGELKWRH